MSTLPSETKKSILFVDDHSQTRLIGQKVLENAGFSILTASGWSEAKMMFEANHFDLLLLDVVMPEMDGYEVCQRIRATSKGRDMPILMMTGLDDIDSIQNAFRAGATDFATKPINWTLLSHRIHYMLRASKVLVDVKSVISSLQESEERLSNAHKIANMGYWRYVKEDDEFFISDTLYSLFGIPKTDKPITFNAFIKMVHDEERDNFITSLMEALNRVETWSFEHRLINPDGKQYIVQEVAEISQKNNKTILSGTMQDISERRSAEEKIRYLAYYDSLTGLPNREYFCERFIEHIEFASRYEMKMALLFLDLDNFKRINDTFGHAVGDYFIREIGAKVKNAIRKSDVISRTDIPSFKMDLAVARFGGDEFTLLLPMIKSERDAQIVARRILDELIEPIKLGEYDIYTTASIGICIYPNDGQDVETLLKHADTAMYHSKEQGKNNFLFYNARMNACAVERLTMETELSKAIKHNDIVPHFQPKYDFKEQRIVGFEILLRWHHPELGQMPPVEFIQMAEDIGMIIPLGYFVFEQACQYIKILELTHPNYTIAVNLSPLQLHDNEIVEKIKLLVEKYKIHPGQLEIEMTESALLDNQHAQTSKLQAIHELGITLSIDNFGTGYSSLSNLKQLPISIVKIDQSFTHNLENSDDDSAITKAIIAMSHNLNLTVLAEGVETPQQLEFLSEQGCDQMQGFLLSKALPFDDLKDFLTHFKHL